MSIIPAPSKGLDELYAAIFLPNVAIISAPAIDLCQLHAENCLTNVSHYSSCSWKVKSSMARSYPVVNLQPQFVGSIINYLQ